MALGAVVALALGWVLRPADHPLPSGHRGDEALAERARELTDGLPSALAVAVVTPQDTRTASIGAPLEGTFEIGSVTKGLTGMLYADAVERGEVSPGTTVGEALGLADVPAAGITLQQLARHRSGLPRNAGGIGGFLRGAWATLLARDPHPDESSAVLDALREVDPEPDGASYSNLGFDVLGHALAAEAGTDYLALLRQRVVEPLGLHSVNVPHSASDLTDRAVTGRDAAGREQAPWVGHGSAPSGGVRADVEDLAVLAERLLAEDAPGADSLAPEAEFDGDRIGAGWITSEHDGHRLTWHNGGTGGFRSWFGMDREAGVGVVLLAATTHDVDAAARELLLAEVAR